ncbi:MAG: hypothetical protein HQK51_20965, partial [Oligoflexia bacterium]|nr:hypothetical protein [Oligoflexia bacterium]
MEKQSKTLSHSSVNHDSNTTNGSPKNNKISLLKDENQKILLDSGNNEVEMLEFVL